MAARVIVGDIASLYMCVVVMWERRPEESGRRYHLILCVCKRDEMNFWLKACAVMRALCPVRCIVWGETALCGQSAFFQKPVHFDLSQILETSYGVFLIHGTQHLVSLCP